jgi:hypothetical protein
MASDQSIRQVVRMRGEAFVGLEADEGDVVLLSGDRAFVAHKEVRICLYLRY